MARLTGSVMRSASSSVPEEMRVVVIGGSGASTPELADALVAWPDAGERRPPIDLVLQGRSAEKLELVASACRARLGADVRTIGVVAEGDLDRALDGADVVLVQVRAGGYDARAFDESFPREFGFPGEETMGPGGFADAIRTVPVLAPIWDRIAAVAPDALVVNLTNPSGIVTTAMRRAVPTRVISICDAPVTFIDGIAKATGTAPEDVRSQYVGMNHAGFWVGPDFETMAAALPAASGIDREDIERLGALPLAYLRFYLHPDRQLAAQLGATETRAQALKRLEAEMLDQYASGVAVREQARRGALWYAVSIVPLLDAFAHGGDATMILGLPNGGAVPWAPADAIVERPAFLRQGGGLDSLPPVELTAPAAELLARHAAYETLAATALGGVRNRDDLVSWRDALVAALLENPMVGRDGPAEAIVDTILARSPG